MPFSKNQRVCATCVYWAGPRRINPTRSIVDCNSTDRGECVGGGHNHASVPAAGHCGKYEKLPNLK